MFSTLELPPEVWSRTVSWLPFTQQRTLLRVSHFFHDIAMPFVFSSVRIVLVAGTDNLSELMFGVEEPLGRIQINDSALEIEEYQARRSSEFLLRVIKDSRFARLVKDLTIVLIFDDDRIATFEQLILSEAFSALSNLQTLRYYPYQIHPGYHHIKNAPKSVRSLICSSGMNLDAFNEFLYLEHLEYSNLDALELAMPSYFDDLRFPLPFTQNSHHRLHILTINAKRIEQIPIWVYTNLTILEIISEKFNDPMNIDFLSHHCNLLEDLSLVGHLKPPPLPLLPTFPKLHSFRLSTTDPVSFDHEEMIERLVRFLIDRKSLRRLCLWIPFIPWNMLIPLIDCLRRLNQLNVLGFHMSDMPIMNKNMTFLEDLTSLKALSLTRVWSVEGEEFQPSNIHLLDSLLKLPNLTYLDIMGEPCTIMDKDEIAKVLSKLTMLGWMGEWWDVTRNGIDVYLDGWSIWKIMFFADCDFHNPDDAWLFKYSRRYYYVR